MADTNLLIFVGATKAGTSWPYRYLLDHQECHVFSLKEYYYFSNIYFYKLKLKLTAVSASIIECDAQFVEAETARNISAVLALGRKIDDMTALMAVLSGYRIANSAYFNYRHAGRTDEPALLDVTLTYSFLATTQIERLAQLQIPLKILLLMRDPMERLWSHVTMHVKRTLSEGQDFVVLCQGILEAILFDNAEAHTVKRGDYKTNIKRFDAVFNRTDFYCEFAENLTCGPRLAAMCRFLGVTATSPAKAKSAHVHLPAPFLEALRGYGLQFLKTQHDFFAEHFGSLPEALQKKFRDFSVIKQNINGYYYSQEGGA